MMENAPSSFHEKLYGNEGSGIRCVDSRNCRTQLYKIVFEKSKKGLDRPHKQQKKEVAFYAVFISSEGKISQARFFVNPYECRIVFHFPP